MTTRVRPSPAALLASVAVLGSGGEPARTPGGAAVRFVDEAAEAGIVLANISGSPEKRHIVETTGAGACFLDYDSDGDLDVYLVNGGLLGGEPAGGAPRDALYQNRGGSEFIEVTSAAGVGDPGWGGGCAAADYDNDGDPDLYLTNYGRDTLYRNQGDGTFLDVTHAAGLGGARWNSGAAFADFDGDGLLDLFVASYLRFDTSDPETMSRRCRWKGADVMCGPRGFPAEADLVYRNRGDGTFTDATAAAGVAGVARYGLGVVVGDLDGDRDPDVVVANDSQDNLLWVNDGRGRFTDQAMTAGVALSVDGRAQAGMGAALGDYDGDGDEDLAITNFSDDYHSLRRNEGGMVFTDVSREAGLDSGPRSSLGWANVFFDYDNDGDLDLFMAAGHVYPQVDQHDPLTSYRQRNLLLANENGRFEEVGARAGPGFSLLRSGRGAAVGDYDDDGDLDLLVVNADDVPSLLRNDGGNAAHWLKVRLVGRRSNRDGIGARLSLEAGGRRQFREHRLQAGYFSSHDPRLHFGLASSTTASLRIRWPSGIQQAFSDLPADHLVVVDEERGMVAVQRLAGFARAPAPAAAAPESAAVAAPGRAAPRPRLTAADVRVIDVIVQRGTRRVLAGQLEEGIQDYGAALERLPPWEQAAASADALGFGDREEYAAFLASLQDNLGVALMRAGRVSECAAPIEHALAVRPRQAKFLRNLALCHFHGRRYGDSIAALAAAREAGATGLAYDLGRAEALAGECAAAEEDLLRAIAELPLPDLTGRRAEAWYHLGGCRASGGRHGEAADAFREALELAPGHQKALFKLERAWRMAGQEAHAARAEALFRARQPAEEAVRSARLGGLRGRAERLALARGQLAGGSPAAALSQLGTVLAAGEDPVALVLLGRAYLAFRPPALDRAQEAFRRALRAAPGSAEAAAGLGDALRRAGLSLDAEAQYRTALQAEPDHVAAAVGWALLELDAGRSAAARARLQPLVQGRQDDARPRRALAEVALTDGGRAGGAEALRLLERSSDLFDDALELNVRALVLAGESERARAAIAGSPFAGAARRQALLRLVPAS
jgi:tetratricopeptide (TPR) repeat protein